MPLVNAGPISQLPPGSVMEVEVGGEFYAVCNAEGTVYAIGGTCLHHGGPLGHGTLERCRVVCPWHLWEFDCRTGEYDRNPNLRVPTYPVRIENGEIILEVP